MREYIWLYETEIAPTSGSRTTVDRPLAVVSAVNTASPATLYVHVDHLNRPVKMTDTAKLDDLAMKSSARINMPALRLWITPLDHRARVGGSAAHRVRTKRAGCVASAGFDFHQCGARFIVGSCEASAGRIAAGAALILIGRLQCECVLSRQ